MNTERRWKAALFKRVVFNSFVGALLTAVVGALCGGVTSVLFAWIERLSNVALAIPPDAESPWIMPGVVGFLAAAGWFSGAIIFSIVSMRAKPVVLIEPLNSFLARVIIGQIAGTLGFCSLFLLAEFTRSSIINRSFAIGASFDIVWLIIGAPVLMICGAIAGVLSKRG